MNVAKKAPPKATSKARKVSPKPAAKPMAESPAPPPAPSVVLGQAPRRVKPIVDRRFGYGIRAPVR